MPYDTPQRDPKAMAEFVKRKAAPNSDASAEDNGEGEAHEVECPKCGAKFTAKM